MASWFCCKNWFLGLFLVGIALEWSGFKKRLRASDTRTTGFSAECNCVAIGPLPTLCLLIFCLIFGLLYPITREVHAEILLKLKQRQTRELS